MGVLGEGDGFGHNEEGGVRLPAAEIRSELAFRRRQDEFKVIIGGHALIAASASEYVADLVDTNAD